MNNKLRNFWVGLAVFLFSLCFAINGSDVSSKSLERNEDFFGKSSGKDELSDLTVKIASLSARRKSKNPLEDAQSMDNFAELAERRYERLSGLIETDAAEVLRVALPDEILSRIPEHFGAFFEKREHLEGELEVISECGEEDGRTLYYLNTEKGRFSLHFAKQPEGELLTGARLNVKGVRVGEAIAVEENVLQTESDNLEFDAPAALPNTLGEQKLLVLLVNFQNDQRQPYTVEQADNLIFNTANNYSTTNYYHEVSYGQTWITGNSFGWFTLPINSGDCNGLSQIATYAKQAAANAGINVSAYDKYMYVYPNMSCSYSGMGTVGGKETWINGSLKFRTVTHELGHNLGLYHSRSLVCSSAVVGSNCSTSEYGHMVDTMGSGEGHFHSYQKERLGWLNYASSPAVTTVQTSGTYFISPFASTDSLSKGLKILKSVDSTGKKTWYYLEFRRPIGFDNYLLSYYNSNLANGIIFTMDKEAEARENYQLDMTPETTSWNDSALAVNRSYTDSGAGVTITPISADAGGAYVNVTFGDSPPPPSPCMPANPTVSLSSSGTQWIGAGSSVSYSVTIKNNNSSECANNSFSVQPTLPAGWTAVVASPILSLAPGATATTSVQVNVPTGVTDGFYSIGFGTSNYSDPSYSASAAANCAVYSSLGVSASPSQSSYTRTQTATVTAYVTANGSPMAGANVTFTMTKANGNRAVFSATSSANGSASFSYKFNKKQDPAGTYLVNVNSNLNGVSGNGSTSFQVK